MRSAASSSLPPDHLRRPPLHPDQYPPPPPPPGFHRLSSCDRHPDRPVTGFCASCLRERLAGLDSNAAAGFSTSSSSRRSTSRPPTNSSSAAAALRSALSRLSGQNSSFELRRCRSFSGSRGPGASAFEPQRRSCDIRGRGTNNSLWSLFHLDDRGQARNAAGEIQVNERPDLGFYPMPLLTAPDEAVLESQVEEMEEDRKEGVEMVEEEEEEEFQEAQAVVEDEGIVEEVQCEELRGGGGGTSATGVFPNAEPALFVADSPEGLKKVAEQPRPMKEHIDLDGGAAPTKKLPHLDFKEIAGSFWLAASVFSKKLQKWRRKQKLKKQQQQHTVRNLPSGFPTARPKKPYARTRRFRETQSEFSEDAFGRRSCDTDPRFSLDASRMSFDDARFSLDEPRASWDGYLFGGGGGRSVMMPRLPPMLAVVEDAPAPAVLRSDGLIPVEEDLVTPGGTLQTREYYSDSSQRRRRSLDRSSSSVRRQLVIEHNDTRLASNAKVTPASGNEFFHHVSKIEREFRDSNLNSARDDSSESLESSYIEANAKKGLPKKARRWSKAWNLWGFIHRSRGNTVERSLSESWTDHNRNGSSGRFLRSNSSVSSRHSFSGNGGFGSLRRSGLEVNGQGKKRRDEFVLERNRSARFSPGHLDNGLLRFYLTPMRSSRRSSTSKKSSHDRSSLFSRNVLRLY